MIEEWRAVTSHPSYQVSDHGRVRSLDRSVLTVNNQLRRYRGRDLSPALTAKGYLTVSLPHRGKTFVHTLVLEAFVGPCPAGMECRHLDDNPINNSLSNLVWGTHSENSRDMVRNGIHPKSRVTHCPKGHLYDAANTYSANGGRYCRACNRDAARRSREKKAGAL